MSVFISAFLILFCCSDGSADKLFYKTLHISSSFMQWFRCLCFLFMSFDLVTWMIIHVIEIVDMVLGDTFFFVAPIWPHFNNLDNLTSSVLPRAMYVSSMCRRLCSFKEPV